MNDIENRIETLKIAIAWNRAFLATLPKDADPKAEEKLAADQDKLAELRAKLARAA